MKNLQRVSDRISSGCERASVLEREVCVVAQMSTVLLGISETVDDVHGDDCVLYRLINLRLQIARAEDIVLKDSYRVDQFLMPAVFEFRE